jgi:hypothetical protein
MPYEIEASTDSCYEGTTCLINKMDEAELAETESALTLANISLLEQESIQGNFDFVHYQAIHKFLFEDLYDWAGEIRTVNLSKKGTQFVPVDEIERVGITWRRRIISGRMTLTRLWNISRNSIARPTCFTPSGRETAGHKGYSSRSSFVTLDILLTLAAWTWMS